jgi:hypothetical protein
MTALDNPLIDAMLSWNIQPLNLIGLSVALFWLGISYFYGRTLKVFFYSKLQGTDVYYSPAFIYATVKKNPDHLLYFSYTFLPRYSQILEGPTTICSWRNQKGEFCVDPVALTRWHVTQFQGCLFKIPTPMDWWVILSEPKLIEELRKAPEHIFSANRSLGEVSISQEPQGNSQPHSFFCNRKYSLGLLLAPTSPIIHTIFLSFGRNLPRPYRHYYQNCMPKWLTSSPSICLLRMVDAFLCDWQF